MSEIRNLQYTADGGIDVELNHPEFGWIPFSAYDGTGDEAVQAVWDEAKDRDDIAPAPAVLLTSADVNAERDRRTLRGATAYLTGVEPIPLKGDDTTQRFLAERGHAAQIDLLSGSSRDYVWRDASNVNHSLTSAQMAVLYGLAAQFIEEIRKASWDLKDEEVIPADFADDAYWPTPELVQQ